MQGTSACAQHDQEQAILTHTDCEYKLRTQAVSTSCEYMRATMHAIIRAIIFATQCYIDNIIEVRTDELDARATSARPTNS